MNPRLLKSLSKITKDVLAAPNWFASSFPAQTAFIKDPARLKAGHCTRRAGKSFGCGIYLCKEAWENPGVSVLYVALTRDSAEKIMWKDILKNLNRRLNLGIKFHDSELKAVFPNGSVIYLMGADNSENQMNQILGQKFKLAVVDEASKFRVDVQRLIFDVIKPAVADYEGTIALIGTADNFVSSYFARVTMGKEVGWAVHKWSANDNPHMKRQFMSEIASLRQNNPNVDNEPWFRQNYLGEWVVDDKARIYHYDQDTVEESPPVSKMTYTLGVYLSYTGKTAFSVLGTTTTRREAFVIDTLTYEDSNIYRAIETIHQFCMKYDISSIKCQESSKTLMKELRSRYGLPIIEATEAEKPGIMQLFATDLKAGYVRVAPGNRRLLDEFDTIIKDDKIGRDVLKEHPQSPGFLSAATIFAWALCYNYTYQAVTVPDDPMQGHWDRLDEELKRERFINDNAELPS